MFKNLKTSDWIAAGIQGLTTFATAYAANALNNGGDVPDKSYQPSVEGQDAAFRIFSNIDSENPNLDFTGNLVENLLSGGSSRTGAPVGFDPALTFVENATFEYGGANTLAGAAVERPAIAPVQPVAPVDTPLPPIQVDLTPPRAVPEPIPITPYYPRATDPSQVGTTPSVGDTIR